MNGLIQRLKASMYADFSTGRLYSRVTSQHRAKDQEIVGYLSSSGYLRIGFGEGHQLVHRVVFALKFGYMPETLDHIDRDRLNNCIDNLREGNRRQNAENCSDRSRTLPRGVRLRGSKYMARLRSQGQLYEGKPRATIDEAVADYLNLAATHHTHNPHIQPTRSIQL